MCGRLVQAKNATKLAPLIRDLRITPDLSELARQLEPQYNWAPTQLGVVVREGPAGRELVPLRWGLIPSWAKDAKIGAQCINARVETVHEKPSFRSAFRQRRCLIPVDGWYEWTGSGRDKQAWYMHAADDGLVTLAGLWERWETRAEAIETFTVITREAVGPLADVHHRMPAVLTPDAWTAWLDPRQSDPMTVLHAGWTHEWLAAHRVGPAVGNVRNNGPDLIKPIAHQGTLW